MRVYAWKFLKNRLPGNQTAVLSRVSQVHTHNTRSAGSGMFISTQDHRAVGYRIPKEWQSLPGKLREMNSLGGFKKKSKEEFLAKYKSFRCVKRECFVCTPPALRNGGDDG